MIRTLATIFAVGCLAVAGAVAAYASSTSEHKTPTVTVATGDRTPAVQATGDGELATPDPANADVSGADDVSLTVVADAPAADSSADDQDDDSADQAGANDVPDTAETDVPGADDSSTGPAVNGD